MQEAKARKQKKPAAITKEELFTDFLVDLFAYDGGSNSSNPVVKKAAQAMLRFQESDSLLEGEGFSTEKKQKDLAELLYNSVDKNSAFLQRLPDASNIKSLSAEHIFASGIGPSNKFQSSIAPLKLSFGEEEKTEKKVQDMEGSVRQSGMSNQYSGNLSIANIPTLKDLQTTNLFTDHFQGDDAEYYAFQNIDTEQQMLMQTVQGVLQKHSDSATFRELMNDPELGGPSGADRHKATSVFMGLLAYGQIGTLELNQGVGGNPTLDDMRKGKFKDIQVSKV